MTATSRASVSVTPSWRVSSCIASTAYDRGITSAAQRSAVDICSRGTNSPASSSCGSANAGMNCTAWNSVRAKALANSPSAMPSQASSSVTRNSVQVGP
jgi:hypothetical protein